MIYYLGGDSNPQIVYEYWGSDGVVAIFHGLNRRPNLVDEVRKGLDPNSLAQPHKMPLSTFDRFAPCRSQ